MKWTGRNIVMLLLLMGCLQATPQVLRAVKQLTNPPPPSPASAPYVRKQFAPEVEAAFGEAFADAQALKAGKITPEEFERRQRVRSTAMTPPALAPTQHTPERPAPGLEEARTETLIEPAGDTTPASPEAEGAYRYSLRPEVVERARAAGVEPIVVALAELACRRTGCSPDDLAGALKPRLDALKTTPHDTANSAADNAAAFASHPSASLQAVAANGHQYRKPCTVQAADARDLTILRDRGRSIEEIRQRIRELRPSGDFEALDATLTLLFTVVKSDTPAEIYGRAMYTCLEDGEVAVDRVTPEEAPFLFGMRDQTPVLTARAQARRDQSLAPMPQGWTSLIEPGSSTRNTEQPVAEADPMGQQSRHQRSGTLPVSESRTLDAREIYALAAESVVVVGAVVDDSENASQGSGVVIAPDTIATNCHVVKGATDTAVGYKGEVYKARLVKGNEAIDYCVLQTVGLPARPAKLAPFSSLSPGQTVYSVGTPHGLELTIASGLVSGIRREEGMPLGYIQTSAPISPGSSGGGLFDDQGRVIGITTMSRIDSQNLNFALPIELSQHLSAR